MHFVSKISGGWGEIGTLRQGAREGVGGDGKQLVSSRVALSSLRPRRLSEPGRPREGGPTGRAPSRHKTSRPKTPGFPRGGDVCRTAPHCLPAPQPTPWENSRIMLVTFDFVLCKAGVGVLWGPWRESSWGWGYLGSASEIG